MNSHIAALILSATRLKSQSCCIMVALTVVGTIVITLLGLLSGDASAWAYGAPPDHLWDTCSPRCRTLPAPCERPVKPRGVCDRAVEPDTPRPQAPDRRPSDWRIRWPNISEWWTRDFARLLMWIALAVLAIGALLFLLLRIPQFRLRLVPAGSGNGTSSAPAPRPSLQPVDIGPSRPRAGDNVLLILRIVAALLSIALPLVSLCQQLGRCPANDVLQRMRERLIDILRWLAQ
jgi:hypothetical protein